MSKVIEELMLKMEGVERELKHLAGENSNLKCSLNRLQCSHDVLKSKFNDANKEMVALRKLSNKIRDILSK